MSQGKGKHTGKADDGDLFDGIAEESSSDVGSRPAAGSGRGNGKVELDIDDAPFLKEEKAAAPPPAAAPAASQRKAQTAAAQAPPSAVESALRKLTANKKRLALSIAGVLLVLLAPLVFLRLAGQREAPPPPPPAAPESEPRAAHESPVPSHRNFTFAGAPFLVERRGSEGELRFLRIRFTVVTTSPALFSEMQHKQIILRDAVYYYLNKKPLTFLTDESQVEALKSDLVSVMNEHLTADKIDELYLEEYLVSGPGK
jgi:flagellar FliL protein